MIDINEIINKIKELEYGKETCVAELINYNPDDNFVTLNDQMKMVSELSLLLKDYNIILTKRHDKDGEYGFYEKFKKYDLNIVINKMVNYIEAMNEEEVNSIHGVYDEIASTLNINGDTNLFIIQDVVNKSCKNKGIILNYKKYKNQFVGHPYDTSFMKKKTIISKLKTKFHKN